MNVNVKTKRDPNNFIVTILNKITMAQNFNQRVDLTITRKRILNCATLSFYLRRRHKSLYLYIRCDGKFGSKRELHSFYKDIQLLIPHLILEGTQGHYTGFNLEICNDTNNNLILLLKLISLLSKQKDFYVKNSKVFKSFFNYVKSSKIPIHLRFTNNMLALLKCETLKLYLNQIQEDKNATLPSDLTSDINNLIDI